MTLIELKNDQLENVWFTADQHFGHENIIKFCDRPFKTVEEMDRILIDNWNEIIKPKDTVFHLGDFTLGDYESAVQYWDQLNGHIKFLANRWHHDKRWLEVLDNIPEYETGHIARVTETFELLPPMVVLEIEDMGASIYPLAITLCHYPLAVWDRKHYGAWCLHGHTHKPDNSEDFVLNVGVDCMNYYPVSLGGVLQYMYEKGHV